MIQPLKQGTSQQQNNSSKKSKIQISQTDEENGIGHE